MITELLLMALPFVLVGLIGRIIQKQEDTDADNG